MSSSKKTKNGIQKRLFHQSESTTNGVTETPSTVSGIQHSTTSKSNQKSNAKRRLHEHHVMRQFDPNQSQGNNHESQNDTKFQTPKGPSLFHSTSFGNQGSSAQANLMTPDQENSGNRLPNIDSSQKKSSEQPSGATYMSD